ncbi:MAG: ribonuclease HII [Salaquimonas sp.]
MSPNPGTDSLLFSDAKVKQPHFLFEQRLIDRGARLIAGVDEAGRGPLAGPVVAAAVILDPADLPDGLNDSKALTEKRRSVLFGEICSKAISISWHSNSARCIDQINILQASLDAMEKSVAGLATTCDHALFDGRDVPLACREFGTAIIKGDARSLSIAAASIVAKVMRDRIMIRMDSIYPEYGFAGHKGYGSKKHMEAIEAFGPCRLHRMSFSPMRSW